MVTITLYDIAKRFIDIKEVKGQGFNYQVMAMLQLDNKWPTNDEIPWCSAFINYCCFLLNYERSKSLSARSWIPIGRKITLSQAEKGDDIVIVKNKITDPDVDVLKFKGHVGFFHNIDDHYVYLLGGNQSDSVNITPFNRNLILSINRLSYIG